MHMFSTIRDYFRIKKALKAIYHNENIEKNLSQIFGVECHQDRVGRLYMVVNPILQNIESDGNTIIFDHNNTQMIEAWVMKNLELSRNFVVENQMFDLLTYNITRIDDDDNFLVVFKNIFFDDMLKLWKTLLWVLFGLCIVGSVVTGILFSWWLMPAFILVELICGWLAIKLK